MKRSGLRSAYLSTDEKFATSCNASNTTNTALFYDRHSLWFRALLIGLLNFKLYQNV